MAARLGVDYSSGRPSPAALRAAGYTFACRYLASANPAKNPLKALSKSEADGLRAGGIDLVSNWETVANGALKGHAQGVADATAAARLHAACGGPPDRPIYFSVDFDASEAQQPAINAYFQGVASVIGLARTGAYGGYWVISRLFDAGLIRYGWQTYAWSGGHWDSRAQLRQVKNGITVGGADCDRNEAHADDFGQWGYQEDDDVSQTTDHIIKAWSLGSQKGDGGEDVEPVKWRVRDEAWQAATTAQINALTAAVTKLASSGTSIDTTAVLAAIEAAGKTESTAVQALQAKVADLTAKLAAAGQALDG